MSYAAKIYKKFEKLDKRLDKFHAKLIYKPTNLPFFGSFFIVLGSFMLYSASDVCQGLFCSSDSHAGAIIMFAFGIMFAAFTGLLVVIFYRKSINWTRWLMLWILAIAFSVAIIAFANYHQKHFVPVY